MWGWQCHPHTIFFLEFFWRVRRQKLPTWRSRAASSRESLRRTHALPQDGLDDPEDKEGRPEQNQRQGQGDIEIKLDGQSAFKDVAYPDRSAIKIDLDAHGCRDIQLIASGPWLTDPDGSDNHVVWAEPRMISKKQAATMQISKTARP